LRKPAVIFFSFLYLVLAGIHLFYPAQMAFHPTNGNMAAFTSRLDARVPHFLESSHVPGASVALIQRGQVVWAKGYGQADLHRSLPVTTETVFQAASISKSVTAWGVMKLVEEGRLDLDAPAERYLARWRFPSSKFDSNQVTIRRLLNHTSGIAEVEYLGYPPDQPLPSLEDALTLGPQTSDKRMRTVPGFTETGGAYIVTPPGQAFIYSDANYALLQLIIEEVSGESFDAYMQQAVLQPLGMTHSSFKYSPSLKAALPYDPFEKPLPDFRFVELAPAGLYTTAPDLARFAAASMADPHGSLPGRGVLSPESVHFMAEPTIPIPGFDGWIYADSYGLGYFIEAQSDGRLLISHMGGNLGWACEFAALPATGDGIVIMTNGSAGHDVFANVLAEWTAWLGRDETHIARAIRLSHRVFDLLTFSALAAAALLAVRLVRHRPSLPSRISWNQTASALVCVMTLILAWTVLRSFMQINIPSRELGILWGLNVLCPLILLNILFNQGSGMR
jgi:CubicO group peptidase (beta-lactamase class C family)